MPLNQADLQVISKVFGKTVEEISGAISSEQEVPLDLRLSGKIYSQEEIDDMQEKLTDAGVEIGYKNLAKALDLEIGPGDKKADVIAEKFRGTITSTLEEKYKNQTPTEELTKAIEKAKEIEMQYNKLKETHEQSLGEIEGLKKDYTGLQVEIKDKAFNQEILTSFPEKMKMDRDDALYIARRHISVEEKDDNSRIIKLDGQPFFNALGEPDTLENAVKKLVEDKKWVRGAGMNGDDRNPPGDSLPRGLSNEKAYQVLKEKGIDAMSEEGSKMFRTLTTTEKKE